MGIFEDLGDIAKGGGKVVDKTLDTFNPFTDKKGYWEDDLNEDDLNEDGEHDEYTGLNYEQHEALMDAKMGHIPGYRPIKQLALQSYEVGRKKGFKKGREEGVKKGREEGVKAGIKALAKVLAKMTDEEIKKEIEILRKKYNN